MDAMRHYAAPDTGPQPTTNYLLVPHQLLAGLRDTPVAVGLWCLMARLFLLTGAPVPLSASDLQAYDPMLTRGAILRATKRLETDHAIITTRFKGQKHRYTPTWGQTNAGVFLWQRDAPHLGRPHHVRCVRIDRTLLDTCMGQLQIHPRHAATIRRRIKAPLLSLRDVGAYALSTLGYHRGTPTLAQWGLVQDGRAQSVPSEHAILARLSQQLLAGATDRLSDLGWRQLGVVQVRDDADQGTPLIFVPPNMIEGMTYSMIGGMIGQAPSVEAPETAPIRAETPVTERPDSVIGSQGNQGNQGITTTPPAGGGTHDSLSVMSNKTSDRRHRATRRESPAAPLAHPSSAHPECASPPQADPLTNHPVAQRLRALRVNPTTIASLAALPLATVEATIRAAEQRPDIRDQAGWVVAALRAAREKPWDLGGTAREVTDWGAVRAWAQTEGLISADADVVALGVGAAAALRQANTAAGQRLGQATANDLTLHAVPVAPDAPPPSCLPAQGTGISESRSRMEEDTTQAHRAALNAPRRAAVGVTARPDWIAESVWNTMPLAVQGVFRGSQRIDGTIHARSLQTQRLIKERYAGWARALVQAVDGHA